MRWIKLPDGNMYTFAVDIQKFAEQNGYVVPCEADGTRHPGTDCNQKMHTIFRDAGLRRTFNLTEQSVVVVRAEDNSRNDYFIHWLVQQELVSSYYVGRGYIQLYTKEAVNALLSKMLNHHVTYIFDDDDVEYAWPFGITTRSQNLEKKRNKPIVSLFNK